MNSYKTNNLYRELKDKYHQARADKDWYIADQIRNRLKTLKKYTKKQ